MTVGRCSIPVAEAIQARFDDLDYLYDLGPKRGYRLVGMHRQHKPVMPARTATRFLHQSL